MPILSLHYGTTKLPIACFDMIAYHNNIWILF